MYRVDGTKITMTRGDTVKIAFPMTIDGEPYELQPGDVVRFAVNTPDHEAEPLISKVLDGYELTLEPEDTKDLEFATYNYDVQITFSGGEVATYIEKAKIKFVWEAD